MSVFVLDQSGRPVMPCTEKRARLLLARGRARVHRLVPFVIRLTDRQRVSCAVQPLRLKLDPGSKFTGLALAREVECIAPDTGELASGVVVLNLFELMHRGRQISEALTARRQMRSRRRGCLRYRAPRFLNRGNKGKGWLAPSLQHRVDTAMAWVGRIRRWAPITAISSELVRFDMQLMQNAEISGVEYQQGVLAGYEVRAYLLAKFDHKCVYCDAKDVPLQVEHIHPKARGGTNRVSNLTLACGACNTKKAARDINEFMAKEPERLARILAQVKKPLKDAAAVNSTRWSLVTALKATGLPVETSTGGRTKFNRSRFDIPKTHALDAVCVGDLDFATDWCVPTQVLKCTGRGSYQRTRLDKYGFPRGYLMRTKKAKGFQTGDMVKAVVTKGLKLGTYTGRVAVRANGNFNIQTSAGLVTDIGHRNCLLRQRADGYGYFQQPSLTKKDAGLGRASRTTRSTAPA